MIKKLSFILLFSLVAGSAMAQSNNSLLEEGSIYSKYGLGVPTVYGSSAAKGMGLWGVSFVEPNVPGVANPAHWGSTVYAMATGGLGLTTYSSTDQYGSEQHGTLGVNHIQIVLPIYKGTLGVSAAFMPYTNTSYSISQSGQRIVRQDTINYVTNNRGQGGINKLQLGLGWRISDHISIGYAASLIFANVDNTYYTVLQQGNSLGVVDKTIQTHGVGLGHRLGVALNFPSLFNENDLLSMGASVTLPVEFGVDQELETVVVQRTEEGELKNDRDISSGNVQLPMGIMAGITYQPMPKLAFSVEGLYQEWSAFKNTADSELETPFVDRFKIGAGLRYYPVYTGSDKFLSSFKYRFGVSYDQGHLKLQGHRVETLMFSLGLGYFAPFTNLGKSSIDISLHYGIRGTKADGLVKENIWKVKLSINLAELFFFRPKVR